MVLDLSYNVMTEIPFREMDVALIAPFKLIGCVLAVIRQVKTYAVNQQSKIQLSKLSNV